MAAAPQATPRRGRRCERRPQRCGDGARAAAAGNGGDGGDLWQPSPRPNPRHLCILSAGAPNSLVPCLFQFRSGRVGFAGLRNAGKRAWGSRESSAKEEILLESARAPFSRRTLAPSCCCLTSPTRSSPGFLQPCRFCGWWRPACLFFLDPPGLSSCPPFTFWLQFAGVCADDLALPPCTTS